MFFKDQIIFCSSCGDVVQNLGPKDNKEGKENQNSGNSQESGDPEEIERDQETDNEQESDQESERESERRSNEPLSEGELVPSLESDNDEDVAEPNPPPVVERGPSI